MRVEKKDILHIEEQRIVSHTLVETMNFPNLSTGNYYQLGILYTNDFF